MSKRKPHKKVDFNKEYYRPRTYAKRKKNYEKLLDKDIAAKEKRLEKIVKKLKAQGYTVTFLKNYVETELYTQMGLVPPPNETT